MIDWIDKSWDIVWKSTMTNSLWWSLVGYSKHDAQRRQTLGHQVCMVRRVTGRGGAMVLKVGGQFRERSERKKFFDPPP